jgi:hypothetical protein
MFELIIFFGVKCAIFETKQQYFGKGIKVENLKVENLNNCLGVGCLG